MTDVTGEYIIQIVPEEIIQTVIESDFIEQIITETIQERVIELDYLGTTYLTENIVISGGDVVLKTAEVALGGHRIVRAVGADDVNYADKDDLSQLHNILGVTESAASTGAEVTVRVSGQMTEPSWNWTPDQYVYLGNNGLLTQTLPDTGYLLVIGTAFAPTVLFVKIGAPFQLH